MSEHHSERMDDTDQTSRCPAPDTASPKLQRQKRGTVRQSQQTEEAWVPGQPPSEPCCVTQSKFLPFSGPQFFYLKN